MAATSKASKKSLTASKMREKARRCLEAAKMEQDPAARRALDEKALNLSTEAELLDGPHADSEGPQFYFSIRGLPNGNCRVDCRVQSNNAATGIEHFEKECENDMEARDWAYEQADARGFKVVIEEEPR
jgi:hypothetical protein